MMGQKRMEENMMYSNVMAQDMSANRNLIGQDKMSNNAYSNMVSQDIINRDMIGQDIINMMGQQISPNFIGRDMSSNMMNTYDINRLPLGQRNTMSQRMQIESMPQSVASRNTL